MTYIFQKQLANETNITIESEDRDFFMGVEEAINRFIEKFTNENEKICEFEIEKNFFNEIENINWIKFENEEQNGFEIEKKVQNELKNSFEENSENELQNIFKSEKNKRGNYNTKTKHAPPIDTKWGRAYEQGGYYYIGDRLSPYYGQRVHKLIYEDAHKLTLLGGAVIHHIDKNSLNNDLDNLQMMSVREHGIIHGKDNQDLEKQIEMSKKRNTSGYFRVCKLKDKRRQNGDMWRYLYPEEGKQKAIVGKTINELEKKVKAKGLHWQKL